MSACMTKFGFGFQKKVELWKQTCSRGEFMCFPLSDAHFSNNSSEKGTVKLVIVEHLTSLIIAFVLISWHTWTIRTSGLDQKSIGLWIREASYLFPRNTYRSGCEPWPLIIWKLKCHSLLELCDEGAPWQEHGFRKTFAISVYLSLWGVFLCTERYKIETETN